MNKESRLIFAAAIVGELFMLCLIVAQNRSMKKNNAVATAAIDRASYVVDIMENCTNSCVEVLNDPMLSDEQRRALMAEQFLFVQIAIAEKTEGAVHE